MDGSVLDGVRQGEGLCNIIEIQRAIALNHNFEGHPQHCLQL